MGNTFEKKANYFIIGFVVTMIFCTFAIARGGNFIFFITTGLIFVTVFVAIADFNKNFHLIFFLFTYFFFLMSSTFVQEVFGVVNGASYSYEAEQHAVLVLFLGVVFLLVGYQLDFSRNVSTVKYLKEDNLYVTTVRQIAKLFFYISYVAYAATEIESILYVITYTYNSYYVDFSSKLPSIVSHVGDICPIAFAIFVATFPSKKECKLPFLLYIFYGLLTFLVGKRFLAIATIIFILTYCLIRNSTDKETGEKWITKKMLVIGILCLPLICAGLYSYAYIRSGNEVDSSKSFLELVLSLFNSVGQSDKVIKYGYMYKEKLPEGHLYSLGGLIDYFKYNKISKLFTGETLTRAQSIEYALKGNGFSYSLTYAVLPKRYVNGYGLGSCYLAELFQDGGYLAVIIGSICYGVMIKNLFSLKPNKIWANAIVFYLYPTLLRAPRDSFDCFLQNIINLKFLIYIIFIFLTAQLLYEGRSKWFRATATFDKTSLRST